MTGKPGRPQSIKEFAKSAPSRVGKIPWRRKWQPTPVFLPGESHGRRSLVVYSPQGCKELDMTEATLHMSERKVATLLTLRWKDVPGVATAVLNGEEGRRRVRMREKAS